MFPNPFSLLSSPLHTHSQGVIRITSSMGSILLTGYGFFSHFCYYYFRVPPCALDRGGRQELGYVADSCWTATATAPAGRTGVVAGGGGRFRVCQHATTPPLAARGARHAGVRRGVQRAAAQRLGLLRGHFLPGGGRLARCTEKKIVAAKQVHCITAITHKDYFDNFLI